jgi:hypothetical protein
MPVMPSPDPVASWYSVRPGSARPSGLSKIMRVYASTLVDDPESMVR